MEQTKRKKRGKTSYSSRSPQERRAFCRITYKAEGHFYHFRFYDFGFKNRDGKELEYNILISFDNISFRIMLVFKNLAWNLIYFPSYEGKAEVGVHS
jgi:hypothetical protein